jgi:hypothetical protein
MVIFNGLIVLQKGDYRLEIKEDFLSVFDENDNRVYYQDSDGYWSLWKYNNENEITYSENSDGYILSAAIEEEE